MTPDADSERAAAAPFLEQAGRLNRQRRLPEAVAILERAVSEQPANAVLLTALGTYLRGASLPDESARRLRRALELRPGDREARFQLGRTLAFDAHTYEALELHQRLLQDYPGDPVLRAELAEDEIAIGAPEKALADLQQIVERDSESIEIRRTLAAALVRLGRYREAVVHLQRIAERAPGYFLAWAGLARAYRGLMRVSDWRTAVERACAISSSGPVSHCLRGDLLFHDGELAEAQACYDTALAIHPRHINAHVALGNLHANLGRTDLAAQHFTAAIDIAPWDGEVQGNWAQFQETSGHRLDLASLGEAARSLPHSRLSLSLGRIWSYVRRDPAQAHEWFAFTVEHLPEEVQALAELSRLDLERDDGASALRTSTLLVELSPDHGGGWYSLGHAAARCHDADRALSAFARAAELLPQEAGVRHGHGVALLSVGRVDEAIAELQRTIELDPESGESALALARAHLRAGHDSDARVWAERAASRLSPEHSELRHLMASLTAGGQTRTTFVRRNG
jgi:tetratricopeptide (TPR) repeat protein